jgi:uncharacterized protein involved in type VI secretion and phage assembly
VPLGEQVGNQLVVEVNGQPLPADVMATLVHGYVDDSSNVPDMFVLRFTDEQSTVLTKGGFSIGVPVRLLVQSSGPGGPVLLLTGEVTSLEVEVAQHGLHTVVRGLDKSHRLFRGKRVEAYLQMTAGDIARKVAQRAGLQAGTIDASGAVLDHVAQDGVTDWSFLRRLAAETGALVAVVDGKLDFTSATPASEAPAGREGSRDDAMVVERGVNLVALRATLTSSDQVSEVEVRSWDVKTKKAFTSVTPAATKVAQVQGLTPAGVAGSFGTSRYVTPNASFVQQSQVDAASKALSAHLASGFAEIEGTVRGNPQMRSGTAVSVVRVGQPFEGRYTLSGTRHDFSPDHGYQTSFTASFESERSLYGLATGTGSGSPSPLTGVVSAIVTNTKDPDQLGRVKVKFPVLSDTYESWWARVVQVGAGAKRGSVWLPEVGDEVLVAFSQDSMQQPYVLGGVFNGQDKPDEDWGDHVDGTDGKIKRRALVSRTGMVVEFLEGPDGEQLNVSTNGGKQRVSLVQKSQAAIQIVSEGPVEVTAKQDVTVKTDSGNVSMSGMKITLDAKSDLELKGVNVKVTGQATAEISAPSVKLSGSAQAEVSGGAMTTISGAMVKIN